MIMEQTETSDWPPIRWRDEITWAFAQRIYEDADIPAEIKTEWPKVNVNTQMAFFQLAFKLLTTASNAATATGRTLQFDHADWDIHDLA
jgi:hypothetical protein